MKKPFIITAIIAVLLLAVWIWVILEVAALPGISMRLVKYQRGPGGAIVRLTNATHKPIRYVTEQNRTPGGNLVLCRRKTPAGWITMSAIVGTVSSYDPRTGKTCYNGYFPTLLIQLKRAVCLSGY